MVIMATNTLILMMIRGENNDLKFKPPTIFVFHF